MAITITDQEQIPDAPWYVLSTDTFMSGWGPAKGLVNRLILPCESEAEAEDVAEYARSRTDTKNVEILNQKPYLGWTDPYLWQVMDPDDSSAWYRLRDGGAS
jgi:hypothetical protein